MAEKTIIYCDRCKKETVSYTDRVKVWARGRVSCMKWAWNESTYKQSDSVVICKDCFNAFKKWMKSED